MRRLITRVHEHGHCNGSASRSSSSFPLALIQSWRKRSSREVALKTLDHAWRSVHRCDRDGRRVGVSEAFRSGATTTIRPTEMPR
jgi:hypothetical protein